MSILLQMARAEFKDNLRNRWIEIIVAVLTVFALSLAVVGSTPIGEIKADKLDVVTVSLASLSVYLVPLIALMLSFDAIVGEAERGTLLLLLSYPVKRWQVLCGKLIGHLSVLGLAIAVSYGIAGIYCYFNQSDGVASWSNYLSMIFSTFILGAVFLSLGYLLSVSIKDRAATIAASIAVWIFFVVVYDFALLGLIITDIKLAITGEIVEILIYLNPTDIYRIYNFTASDSANLVSGMGLIADTSLLQHWMLMITLMLWIVFPLIAAIAILNRRDF